MSDGIIVKGTESADPGSFWRKIFVGSRGIRSGWRLTMFLSILREAFSACLRSESCAYPPPLASSVRVFFHPAWNM